VVTGAASGIGGEVTARLLAGGAAVTALDRVPAVEDVRTVEVDLADPDSIDAALTELDGEYDALFNIAGVPGTPEQPGELVMRVDFLGLRHLTEHMLDRLRPGGAIVNIASVAAAGWPQRLETIKELLATETFDDGLRWFAENPPDGNPYRLAKEAVIVYTMASALRLRERGLRMNALLPGSVETPMLAEVQRSMGTELLDGVRDLIGRHATPADIAPAAVFLASPDSRWISATTVIVDGGYSGAISTELVTPPVLT